LIGIRDLFLNPKVNTARPEDAIALESSSSSKVCSVSEKSRSWTLPPDGDCCPVSHPMKDDPRIADVTNRPFVVFFLTFQMRTNMASSTGMRSNKKNGVVFAEGNVEPLGKQINANPDQSFANSAVSHCSGEQKRFTPLLILKRSPTTIRKSCFSQWSVSPIRLEQEYHSTWQEQNLLGLL